jgi:hypothetical protein
MPQTWVEITRFKDYHRAPNACNDNGIKDNTCPDQGHADYASAEADYGGGDKCRAVSVCRDEIDAGGGSNPCFFQAPVKAKNRRFIHNLWGFSSIPGYGLECDWDVNDDMLRQMSQNPRYTSATITSASGQKMNVWEQLLFGIRTGPKNTEGQGYCNDVGNLLKQVHSNGNTCYDVIKDRNQEAEAKRKGQEYCRKWPNSQQCKCINISQPGGVNYCLQNPSLPGCDKVVRTFNGIPEKARTQFSLANMSTGCYNGTACAGSGIFLPDSIPQPCNQTITVCDQVIKVGDISGGTVNIDQKMKCGPPPAPPAPPPGAPPAPPGAPPAPPGAPPAPPGAPPAPPSASFADFRQNPRAYFSFDNFGTDTRAKIGVGGVTFTLLSCGLIVLLLVLGGGGGSRRFRRR